MYAFKKAIIKTKIRELDNFTCCFCGEKNNRIPVHHIDYDKTNNDESNLICLCKRCLKLTKDNHGYWQVLFAGLMSGSKVVRKGWGFEIHIVNNEKYCLKYLVFFKDKKFSHHYHLIKQECWHCIFGKLELFLEKGEHKDWITLTPGSKIEIFPGQIHQLKALKNSMIVEVSSRDFPEDSIRLIKGD